MKITEEAFTPRKKKREFGFAVSPAIVCLVVMFAFALIFWWARVQNTEAEEKILVGSNTDMYMYHLPVRAYGFGTLKDGELPLWNPYTNCGMPFLSTYQAALFYPLNFPHLFFRPETAISLIYLLHIFLAGAFMYLWLRELDAAPAAATFAGTAYMLCSFVSYVLAWPHIILCHTWIPIVFFFLHRTFLRAGQTDMILLAAALGCQFLAGYMQGFVYTLYGAFAYLFFLALVRLVRKKGEPSSLGRPFLYSLAGMTVIPAVLTAFQWLPTYHLSRLSVRSAEGLSREAILVGGSLFPSTFFTALVNPDSFKWFQYTLYPGILTLVLAVFALLEPKRRRFILFFLGMAAIFTVISFGSHTPIFDLYRLLPTGSWFRLPNRLLILTAFSIITMAGLGCDHLLADVLAKPAPHSRGLSRYGLFLGLCGLFILLLPKVGALYVFILFIACILAARGNSGTLVGSVAIVLVALDLTLHVFNPVTYPWITPRVFPDLDREVEFLRDNTKEGRAHIFRAKHDWKNYLLNANVGMVERIRETSGYESLSLQRFAEFCAYMDTGGPPSASNPFTGTVRWTSDSAHPRLLNLLGARYIVNDAGRDLYPERIPENKMPKGFDLKEAFSGKLTIYENDKAIPRALFVKNVEVVKDKSGALARLADPKFDYRTTIVLEEEPEVQSPASAATQEKTALTEIIVKTPAEGKIDLTVSTAEPGFIFLNDVWMPGWRAVVDGKETKVYRADYLFMAVPVDTGKHSISFLYVSQGFRAGAWISCASLVLLSFLLAFDYARRRAKKMAPWETAPKKPERRLKQRNPDTVRPRPKSSD